MKRTSFLHKGLLAIIATLFLLITLHSAIGMVDLVNPQDNYTTTSTNITFDYYVSMPNLLSCTLFVNNNPFPDMRAQSNAMNSVQVGSMNDGIYNWNVSCNNGTDTTFSLTRTLTIDTHAPSITKMMPQAGATYNTIPVDIVPYDALAPAPLCSFYWDNADTSVLLDTRSIPSSTRYQHSYSSTPGNGTLRIRCSDNAGNIVEQNTSMNYVPDYGVFLSLDKNNYGITESVHLTIDTLSGANVTVDVCPDQSGFVQCSTALLPSTVYPQTITLPYLNKTGPFLVEATAVFGAQTKINRTRYNITNSMFAQISASKPPRLNTSTDLSVIAGGGVAPYRFVWLLDNGTAVANMSVVSVLHTQTGTYTQRVVAYDSSNNNITTNITYTIKSRLQIIAQVLDATNGQPIGGADVSAESGGVSYASKSLSTGLAYLVVEPGSYSLFASAPGYTYLILPVDVVDGTNPTFTLALQRDASQVPIVSILQPTQQASVTSPAQLQFNVVYASAVSCSVYANNESNASSASSAASSAGLSGSSTPIASSGGAWHVVGDPISVSDSATKAVPLALPVGDHSLRVQCNDLQSGKVGTSSMRNIHVTSETTSATNNNNNNNNAQTAQDVSSANAQSTTQGTTSLSDEIKLQNYADYIDERIIALDTLGQKEKTASLLVEYDRQLRNVKRAVQQAIRDMSDLQFRNDLDGAGRTVEQKKILANVEALLASTPKTIVVTDSKSYVRYAQESDVDSLSQSLVGLGSGSLPNDTGSIAKHLLADQQKFTVSTTIMNVDYIFPDATKKSVTLVSHDFTYANNLSSAYHVYEVLPKDLTASIGVSTKDLELSTAGQRLSSSVVQYDPQARVTYVIPKTVDLATAQNIKTVLAQPYASDTMLSGFAIVGLGSLGDVSIGGMSAPLILLIAFLVLLYIIYYFDLVRHARFFVYRLGKKSKLHYTEVMINDAHDQLAAGNYEKADMLFKEIRMTYDTLPLFAKNEVYEDIAELLTKMDTYYFNMIMLEFDQHLKANDVDAAIASYEKLTNVYTRLNPEQQAQLSNTINALAHRLEVNNVAA